MIRSAVILARGLGTRMRAARPGLALAPEQEARAAEGQKGMIPVGRPFLDYVLSGLADAGYARVCLVIGPEHRAVREYYTVTAAPSRLRVHFAVQERPLGTADAVLAAEAFTAGEGFLTVNADNLYPRQALEGLRGIPGAGLAGFRRSSLLAGGAILPERVLAFALIEASNGYLTRIVEKPDPETAAGFGADPLVSMNAWVFRPAIFASARAITPSPRGELELQDAVRHSMTVQGERYRVLECDQDVLDLSSRSDIPIVTERLRGKEVRL